LVAESNATFKLNQLSAEPPVALLPEIATEPPVPFVRLPPETLR